MQTVKEAKGQIALPVMWLTPLAKMNGWQGQSAPVSFPYRIRFEPVISLEISLAVLGMHAWMQRL